MVVELHQDVGPDWQRTSIPFPTLVAAPIDPYKPYTVKYVAQKAVSVTYQGAEERPQREPGEDEEPNPRNSKADDMASDW